MMENYTIKKLDTTHWPINTPFGLYTLTPPKNEEEKSWTLRLDGNTIMTSTIMNRCADACNYDYERRVKEVMSCCVQIHIPYDPSNPTVVGLMLRTVDGSEVVARFCKD